MNDGDAAGFAERFTRVWSAPEPDAFAGLRAEERTLDHPSGGAPIPHHEIPDYLRNVEAMVPDISLCVPCDADKLRVAIDPSIDRGHPEDVKLART